MGSVISGEVPSFHYFLPLDLLLEYWIEHFIIGLLHVRLTCIFSTRIFYRGVPGFVTDCPCNVRCCGIPTCLLYICHTFWNLVLNGGWFESLTLWNTHIFIVFIFMHKYFSISPNTSILCCLLDLFSRLNTLFSYNGNTISITAHINYVKSIQNPCVNDMNRFILLFLFETTVDLQLYYIKVFHPSNLLHFIAGHVETSQLMGEDCSYATWSPIG